MATQLDGTKPLWSDLSDYMKWIWAHRDELHDAYMAGDEYADIIVQAVVLTKMRRWTEKQRYAFVIVVERYISEHHPEIAVIVK